MRPRDKTRQDLPPHRTTKTAGDLRHRITLQAPTDAADSAGQMIPDWADTETIVWGLYEQTGGSEVQVGEQVRSFITGMVTIRANSAFSTPKMRLKVNGSGLTNLIVNVTAIMPPDPDSGLQAIMVEQPATGITQ